MTFNFTSRSALYDAVEAITEEGLRNRITVDGLSIHCNDEDAYAAVESLLSDLGLMDEIQTPGEDMDGDHDSAMESAGFGYDEQYEHGTPNED